MPHLNCKYLLTTIAKNLHWITYLNTGTEQDKMGEGMVGEKDTVNVNGLKYLLSYEKE